MNKVNRECTNSQQGEPLPSDQQRGPLTMRPFWWAVTNFGRLIEVRPTRKEAISFAVGWLGQPWERCKRTVELRKVRIEEIIA